MCFSQPYIINPMYIQQLTEVALPLTQITVGVCKDITLLILYQASSTLDTLLKHIYSSTYTSDVLVLTIFLYN